jgi:hypothetical protein
MADLEERLRKRLEELKTLQAQTLAQLNAINGAIGEIEAILNPPAPPKE